jgi:hypothetical protein
LQPGCGGNTPVSASGASLDVLARPCRKARPQAVRLVATRRSSGGWVVGGGASPDRAQRPGTFDLLGFTHYWGKALTGSWVLKRRTSKSRIRRSVRRLNEWCRLHRHYPRPWQHEQLSRKQRGYDNYYGLTGNFESLVRVRRRLRRIWRKWLNRRSQRKGVTWKQFQQYLKRHPLPRPFITHRAIP